MSNWLGTAFFCAVCGARVDINVLIPADRAYVCADCAWALHEVVEILGDWIQPGKWLFYTADESVLKRDKRQRGQGGEGEG